MSAPAQGLATIDLGDGLTAHVAATYAIVKCAGRFSSHYGWGGGRLVLYEGVAWTAAVTDVILGLMRSMRGRP